MKLIPQPKFVQLLPGRVAIVATVSLLVAAVAQGQGVHPDIISAKGAASVADIEQIVLIGKSTADKIGNGQIPFIKQNTKALSRYMAEEIIAKPTTATGSQRIANKVDEIGETAAFISEAIVPNPQFKKLKTGANPNLLAILKGSLRTAKNTAELIAANVVRDVVGSVSLTIHNNALITDNKEQKILVFLLANKKSVAGIANKAVVKAALIEGFSGSPQANLIYEDGNLDALAQLADPETDFRNF